jgi:hypothetical protein
MCLNVQLTKAPTVVSVNQMYSYKTSGTRNLNLSSLHILFFLSTLTVVNLGVARMLRLGEQAEKLAQALSSSGNLEFLVEILFGPLPPSRFFNF